MTRASDRSPDLVGLTAFTGREDRQSALFFAGRAREIEAVERTCAAALDSVRAGAPFQGATRLFQGAPGAGKTALLTALQQRWGKPDAPADAPLPVVLEWGHLHSEAVVAGAILKAVDPAMEETYRRTGTVGLDAGLRIPGVSVGGRVSGSTAPPSLTFLELVRAVPPSAWTRPVCLMVDEIQMVNTPTMNVLNQLHSGSHGLPIVPLYAGLGSSLDVLATHGLSRLAIDAVHDIGALAPEEAQGAVRMMFERYRVDLEGVDHDWPSELASLSECWPQHLHNAMRALAEGLVAVGGRLAAVDSARVLDRDRHYRTISYSRRVSPAMDEARCLVGAVMAALPEEGLRAGQVLAAITRFAKTDMDPEWGLPDGMTARGFLHHLVHQGALQRGTDKLYHCPIPSFWTYLVGCGKAPALEPTLKEYNDLPAPS